MAKELSYAQVEDRKRRAEQFLRDVKQDDDRADEVSDESVESYAQRRGFDIVDNPETRSLKVANANMSKDELLDYIDELESENSDMQDTLDSIQDLISAPATDDDTDTADDADDDDAAVNAAAADDY